jgi:hypothetical protein
VNLLLGEGAMVMELHAACEQGHDAIVRLLLQHGAISIQEDEVNFKPAANVVLRQWDALSPARQEIVRRYDWSFVDLPTEWTVQHHMCQYVFRHQMAAIALGLHDPLASGDLMHPMAEVMHGLMGFGDRLQTL